MPMIDITMTEDSINESKLDELVENLTTALIQGEGAPDNEYVRSLSWCFVDKRPKKAISVGGAVPPKPHYRIVLTVPEGAPRIHGPLMKASRQALSKKVTELVLNAEGAEHTFENFSRVWVQMQEISNGFWGAFGDIAEMNDIGTFAMGTPAIGHQTERGSKWRSEFAKLND
jgi:phenylpyruvate tautomerase PptA (4-oxalocrotonate tautomerase family)